MDKFVADFNGVKTILIELAAKVGEGAAGEIYRVSGHPGLVAKMYRPERLSAALEAKVVDMIRVPPDLPAIIEAHRTFLQIAWPTAVVRDKHGIFRGFIMPEIDVSSSMPLENIIQKSSRRANNISEFYGFRVLLAANLATVMAELHRVGHHFIDMKPINLRFYPTGWKIAILDTDGFSIQGARRWPADGFSDEYIAPEARDKLPEQLGLAQDLFALAAIVFRLMNNGVHPFQGKDKRLGLPTAVQERIFTNLYAFGVVPSGDVAPVSASLHDSFDAKTRALFDRAFRGPADSRPTAREWGNHLRHLIESKILVTCTEVPQEHMHFGGRCGLCALDAGRPRGASPNIRPPNGPSGLDIAARTALANGHAAAARWQGWATVGIVALAVYGCIAEARSPGPDTNGNLIVVAAMFVSAVVLFSRWKANSKRAKQLLQ